MNKEKIDVFSNFQANPLLRSALVLVNIIKLKYFILAKRCNISHVVIRGTMLLFLRVNAVRKNPTKKIKAQLKLPQAILFVALLL